MSTKEKILAFADDLRAFAASTENDRPVNVIYAPYPLGDYVYEVELVAALGSRDKAKRLIRDGAFEGRIIGHTIVAKRVSFFAYLNNEGSGARPRAKPNTIEATAEEVARAALRSSNVRVLPQRQWDARAPGPSNDTATTSTHGSNSPTAGDVSSTFPRRAKR